MSVMASQMNGKGNVYQLFVSTNVKNTYVKSYLLFRSNPSVTDDSLNKAWISNHLPGKMWDQITCPLLNFNGCTIEV